MENDFSLLVSKALSGEASEQERLQLSKTLKDSENNAELYNSIKEYWNADVVLDKSLTENVNDKIWSRIHAIEKKKSVKRDFLLFFYRAAAVVLLLLTCWTFYYSRIHSKHLYTYAAQNAVTDYILQDGTKVKLNKNSSITFDSSFGEKDRKVDLTGEAFFEVNKDVEKTFSVRAQNTETKVSGTKFNVLSDMNNGTVTVALVEGSVSFCTDRSNVVLHPQEEIIYNVASSELSKQVTDLQFNTAWTIGRYIYSNISFGEFSKKLEHIYNVSISIDSKEIAERNITASFMIEQPVEEILSALENELGFKYVVVDRTIEIVKNKGLIKKRVRYIGE
ncbi:MAG: FecR domain-containing protein [Dysgonamonadaceae bacterium]|jgi:ferric-dicitrate binding protein FerR (iron transport regulator)|nr:FecR domain-containing protein [Dysgonamonadaceae bacterium]